MAYPPYLREKARQLRSDKILTIDEIAERLAVSRKTIFYWVGDMPRPARCVARRGPGHALGNRAMQAKYQRLRDEAHELGRWEFHRLARTPTFRDFVCLYIAEGYKRDRNRVAIGNSDPAVVKLAAQWIRHFSRRTLIAQSNFTPIRTQPCSEASGPASSMSIPTRSSCSASPTAVS